MRRIDFIFLTVIILCIAYMCVDAVNMYNYMQNLRRYNITTTNICGHTFYHYKDSCERCEHIKIYNVK